MKLTKKEREFAKNYALSENGTESIIKAKYKVKNRKVAGVIAVQNLAKPSIVEKIEMERKSLADSIPDELLTQRHLDLLNKKEVKRSFQPEVGEWVEIETGQVDTYAVAKGLEMAYKLKGAFSADNIVNNNLVVQVSKEVAEKYGIDSTQSPGTDNQGQS